MKQLALQAGIAVLAGLVLAIAMGILTASSGGSVAGLRDVAIIVLALFTLVGSIIAGAAYFAGAWAVGRFGAKGVAAVGWVGRKVVVAEEKATAIVDRAAVRPVARTARLLTASTTFVRHALGAGEREAMELPEDQAARRPISDLERQKAANPLGLAEH